MDILFCMSLSPAFLLELSVIPSFSRYFLSRGRSVSLSIGLSREIILELVLLLVRFSNSIIFARALVASLPISANPSLTRRSRFDFTILSLSLIVFAHSGILLSFARLASFFRPFSRSMRTDFSSSKSHTGVVHLSSSVSSLCRSIIAFH